MGRILNALTIDVEEYFQVHNFEKIISRGEWDSFPVRVLDNTRRILNILARHRVHATFFILGWVANHYPVLVREIALAGHEIATHGYSHELIYRQSPAEFTEDLAKSLGAITMALQSSQPHIQASILGYRAPAFSLTPDSMWALDILRGHGLRYDSSIFPIAVHDRYGRHTSRFATQVIEGLWEFPISTFKLGGINWPVGGGGYFRLLPFKIIKFAIRRINAAGKPAVIYLHPWELDPGQPKICGCSRVSYFRHYLNLHKTEARFHRLLEEFQFKPIRDVFAEQLEGR
jgi:polysaccharide deacetylase family protein (PEP-CTERM system associated)